MGASDASRQGALEQAVELLRRRILSGGLPGGSPLRESRLCGELGVSRPTLREALHVLAGHGLVVRSPHRGVYVRDLTAADVRECFLLRRVVELEAARRAARVGAAARAGVEAAYAELRERTDLGELSGLNEADMRLHVALVATLGSPRLDGFFGKVLSDLQLAFAREIRPETSTLDLASLELEHAGIFERFLAGDGRGCAGLLAHHLENAEQRVLALLA